MPDMKRWVGLCEPCSEEITITEDGIREGNPDFTEPIPDRFIGVCGECGEQVQMDLERPMTVTEVPFSKATLLPPPPGTCPECAVVHEPDQPHNRDSLYYQYAFRLAEAKAGREERWPTWADAMAHCDEETRDAWRLLLRDHGVEA